MNNHLNATTPNHVQEMSAINKLIRNTYMLLGMTLICSTVTAAISMAINPPFIMYLGSVILSFVLLFILNKKQNSPSALPLVFCFTGLLGFGLGPVLNHYLGMANGAEIITLSLAMTAITFLGLSSYVMSSKRDFSFMGGFLATGMIIALVAMVALIALPFFGVNVGAANLVFSAFIVLLMSGFILYDTSNIINGHYKNYIMATVSLYLNIYNLFIHLLSLVSAFTSDD